MNNGNNDDSVRKRKKVKILLPAAVVATSSYYSFLFTAGIIAGYVICKLFCNIFLESGKVDSVFIDYGKWTIHLHHWIIGAMALLVVWMIDSLHLPTFFIGFVLGIIIQDIYDYNDWHKVIIKNEGGQGGTIA